MEIGVSTGLSLSQAEPPTRCLGIDPAPQVSRKSPAPARIFPETSDDFFAKHDLLAEPGGNRVRLAFIDGLHHFDAVLRDFMNIERHSSRDTVVLLHDCLPVNSVTAMRERKTKFWIGQARTWYPNDLVFTDSGSQLTYFCASGGFGRRASAGKVRPAGCRFPENARRHTCRPESLPSHYLAPLALAPVAVRYVPPGFACGLHNVVTAIPYSVPAIREWHVIGQNSFGIAAVLLDRRDGFSALGGRRLRWPPFFMHERKAPPKRATATIRADQPSIRNAPH